MRFIFVFLNIFTYALSASPYVPPIEHRIDDKQGIRTLLSAFEDAARDGAWKDAGDVLAKLQSLPLRLGNLAERDKMGRGVLAAIREAVGQLKQESFDGYLLQVDARAREALKKAEEKGDRDKLRQTVAVYPKTQSALHALVHLCMTSLSRGEYFEATACVERALEEETLALDRQNKAHGNTPPAAAIVPILKDKHRTLIAAAVAATALGHEKKAAEYSEQFFALSKHASLSKEELSKATPEDLEKTLQPIRGKQWPARSALYPPSGRSVWLKARALDELLEQKSLPRPVWSHTFNPLEGTAKDTPLFSLTSLNGFTFFRSSELTWAQRNLDGEKEWARPSSPALRQMGKGPGSLPHATAMLTHLTTLVASPKGVLAVKLIDAPNLTVLASINPTTGGTQWRLSQFGIHEESGELTTDPIYFCSAPLVVDRHAYILASSRGGLMLLRVDVLTGALRGAVRVLSESSVAPAPAAYGQPTYTWRPFQHRLGWHNGYAVIQTVDGWIASVDTLTMTPQWAVREHDLLKAPNANPAPFNPNSPILFEGNRALTLSTVSHKVFAVDLKTGALAWQKNFADGGHLLGIQGGRLFSSSTHEIQSLEVSDGTTYWHNYVLGISGRGVLTEDSLVIPLETGVLASLDLHSGHTRRVYAIEGAARPFRAHLSVSERGLYVEMPQEWRLYAPTP